MSILDPVAAYTAATDVEAHIICGVLHDAGIEAVVVEDLSRAGVWMFGILPAIHRPQVWIDRRNIERARPVLEEYVRQAEERRAADRESLEMADKTIAITCEECGVESEYPAAQAGSVQLCPHCFAHVDVGNENDPDWFDESGDDER